MKEVLQNLANYLLIEWCKANGINPSSSFIAKNGRGYEYQLCDYHTGKAFAHIKFSKSTAPIYWATERLV